MTTSSRAASYDGYEPYDYLSKTAESASITRFRMAPAFDRVPSYDLGLDPDQLARVQRLIAENFIVSLHDHPVLLTDSASEMIGHIRLNRPRIPYQALAASGMNLVFDNLWANLACITSNAGWKWSDLISDLGMRRADIAHQNYVRVVETLEDIEATRESGALGMVFGIETATPIENELDRLDIMYGFGIRQVGIAYSESNLLGSGLKESQDGGLTLFGHKAVTRMNDLGIAVDISHAGDKTSRDTIDASSRPVLITHSGARGVWPIPRLKPDDVIIACAARGGVIGIEAAPHTTISPQYREHSLESVIDHFDYCVDLVGIDHVAFGPDTIYGDHVGLHREAASAGLHLPSTDAPEHPEVDYVAGVENPTEEFHNIIGALVKRGYSDADISKAVGGNVLRVLKEIW